jgi:hypothetical protein
VWAWGVVMGQVSTAARAPSIVPSASSCAPSIDDLRQILQIVCTLHPNGARKWLERATGAAPRTVDYWVQGRYLPRGAAALKIVAALRAEHEARGKLLQQFELDLR